ncbi:MAG: DUF192 domain-containing protein [Candidatus Colwellbacteria bacterium]|nr:DUF192 domain-containing protein [Candidatus Colwellbacteria bacterium]
MDKKVIGLIVISVIFIISVVFAALSVTKLVLLAGYDKASVGIGTAVFSADIADTESERDKGLSGRSSMADDRAMLFRFNNPSVPVFWMKDMKFPLDIIWIRSGRVVGYVTDIYPEPGISEKDIKRYSPPTPVDMVLEAPAGSVGRHGISIGDGVTIGGKEIR